jgi:type VI secretion system secreted protein Hcp
MADVYAFLDLDGIEGEAQDSKFNGKIEIQSFHWGASNNSSYISGTGGNIGKGQIQDISISKFMCKASPELFKRCVTGKQISKGKLSLCKLAGDDENSKLAYYEVELENVVITSHQFAASGGQQLPMESITLHFVVAKSTYKPQQNDGSLGGGIPFGGNLQQNVEVAV